MDLSSLLFISLTAAVTSTVERRERREVNTQQNNQYVDQTRRSDVRILSLLIVNTEQLTNLT